MSASRPTLGMGILSWRGAASLEQSLSSYAKAGLYGLFDQRVIILPDPDSAVKEIAAQHPLERREFPNNLGIAGGMRAAAEALGTDYVLFLENDCPLIEPLSAAKQQINICLNALIAGDAFMARLRSRHMPGELFTTLPKYRRYWDDSPRAKIYRTLRPHKAKRLCGTAIYARPDPHKRHPEHIRLHSPDTYIISPKVMPWTNQSILMRRSDFLGTIMPYIDAQPLKRAINGFHNVEIELNRSRFWTRSDFNIICPPGLFTHKRYGARGY